MRLFIMLFAVLMMLTACNLPNTDDSAPEEAPLTDVVDLDLSTEAIEPTSTPTEPPTRTPFPTSAAVPTNRTAPTPLPLPATGDTGRGTEGRADVDTLPVRALAFDPVRGDERAVGFVASGETGLVSGDGLNLLNLSIDHYSQNPANKNRFAVVDSAGMLYITSWNGADAFRVEQGPFTQFPAESRASNNAATDLAVWSPDGQYVAFIVNAEQQASDGVWYLEPGVFAPLQLIVDCPFEGARSCMIVQPADETRFWKSRALYWSPDSGSLLVNVELADEGRRGLMVIDVTRNERVRDRRPPLIYYDYGTWGSEGRILASGRNPGGVYRVDWLNRDGTVNQTVYDASANGLWLGWAVQQTDTGEIVALGRPNNPDGPVAVYSADGQPLSGFIGEAFPQRVVWSPNRRFVLVEAGGRRYIAGTNGQITDITEQTSGLPVNWLR
ncbi:MAG: hypothetical protein ACOCX3_01700 [Chloroflexota bacterium]